MRLVAGPGGVPGLALSSMSERSFLDTNVLVYRFDRSEPTKRAAATRLLDNAEPGSLVISTQVLQEFYAVTTRKLAQPLSEGDAATAVDHLSALAVVGSDATFVRAAISISRTARLSLWDALIVQAALTGGCSRVLTEDLQHDAMINGLRVENPFLLS